MEEGGKRDMERGKGWRGKVAARRLTNVLNTTILVSYNKYQGLLRKRPTLRNAAPSNHRCGSGIIFNSIHLFEYTADV